MLNHKFILALVFLMLQSSILSAVACDGFFVGEPAQTPVQVPCHDNNEPDSEKNCNHCEYSRCQVNTCLSIESINMGYDSTGTYTREPVLYYLESHHFRIFHPPRKLI